MNNTEIWVDIPDVQTHQVSNKGNVRSKTRVSKVINAKRLGTYQRYLKGRPITQHREQNGYMRVSLNDNPHSVHRLVAKAFLNDSYFEKAVVNHKDGSKQNNNLDNLEWVTYSQNELHSHRELGKVVWNKGIHYDTTNAVAVRKVNYLERCRKTHKLRYIHRMKIGAIAEKLGLTTRSVHKQLKDIREVV